LIENRDLQGARDAIRQMRRWSLPSPQVDLFEAKCCFAEGRWPRAREILETARPLLAQMPRLLLEADLLLGRCYEQVGYADLALAAYRRAVATDPQSAPAQSEFAAALLRLGRFDEAADQYQRLAAARQATAEDWIAWARTLVLRNRSAAPTNRSWREAEQVLEAASGKAPGSVSVLTLRAEALAAQGKRMEAGRLLRRATEQHPGNIEVSIALANLADQEGRLADALAVLSEADRSRGVSVEVDLARLKVLPSPREGSFRRILGAVSAHLKQLVPDDRFRLLAGLADCLERSGKLREAKGWWQ
jgi:tetratricopeptide (TPR) repeat protein